MKCYNHPTADAVGVCKVCQKGICRECAIEHEIGIVCQGNCYQRAAGFSDDIPRTGKNRRGKKLAFSLVAAALIALASFAAVQFMRQKSRIAAEERTRASCSALAIQGGDEIRSVLEKAMAEGQLSLDDIFDQNYRLISGTDPQKFHTRFDGYLDAHIQLYIDQLMEAENVLFAVPVDRNGYLPTHNSKYSRPLTGDPNKDRIGNRTKRIFNDPVGLASAKYDGSDGNEALVQIYQRDTGATMMDCSAPISLEGRHWGAFRVGMEVR